MSNLKKVKVDNLILVTTALIFGSIYSFYLLQTKIFPFNTDWLFATQDSAQAYLGWLSFRQDSWHWPLSLTGNMFYPEKFSIGYTDSIPIVAIIFKLFSSFIPDNFQYFGCFILLNFTLQFFWGANIALLFSPNNFFKAVGAGILFMITPILTMRIGHIALTSHWLILSSIWCYFRYRKGDNPKERLLFQSIIILVASGIHPYLAVMSYLIIIASNCQLLISVMKRKLLIILDSSLLTFLLIAGWLFFGYLTKTYEVGNSWGVFSVNLNSIVNPMDYSLFLKSLPMQPYQYEGFNYIGIGVLLLIFANLINGSDFINWLANRKRIIQISLIISPIIIICILLTLFALSNKVYWGDNLIWEYQLLSDIESIFSKFRASGRFIWPVHYLILMGCIYTSFKLWNDKQLKFLIPLVIGLQFIDLIPGHSVMIKFYNNSFHNPLVSQEWQQLSASHKKLILAPSNQCGNTLGPFPVFERFALLNGMKTNSAYLARYSKSDLEFHCLTLPNSILSGNLEKDTVYILDKTKNEYVDLSRKINLDHNHTHYCSELDSYMVCKKR